MTSATTRARAFAFYLPQYHPTPENDEFWGPGFTEWTNVARGRPLFRGHQQPRLPGLLGFYDLRLPEVRAQQASLAQSHGIEAFLYWHYWFAGRRVLDRPFREVVESGEPQFPFAAAWANESWTGVWHGLADRTLIKQSYPGADDHRAHFAALEAAFHDPRYVRVNGRPLFYIYRPAHIPDLAATLDLWRRLAVDSGLPGLHIVGEYNDLSDPRGLRALLDGLTYVRPGLDPPTKWRRRVNRLRGRPWLVDYGKLWPEVVPEGVADLDIHPSTLPNWDNTPRSGQRGRVYLNATPQVFARQLERAVRLIEHKPSEQRLVFVKSWNEWAEGNYLEPDAEFGMAWLEAARSVLASNTPPTTRTPSSSYVERAANVGGKPRAN